MAAAVVHQCGKKRHTDFVLQCGGNERYEMLPVDRASECGGIVSDFGCAHKATVEDIRQHFKDREGIDAEYGFLPDGRKVTIRITSSDERPTIEISPIKNSGAKKIKIRYGEKSKNNKD